MDSESDVSLAYVKRRGIRRSRGPVPLPIPDLRFEQSYLGSIRRFIQPIPSTQGSSPPAQDEKFAPEKTAPSRDAIGPEFWLQKLQLDWFNILRVTLFDQIVSQVVQGTLFALVGVTWTSFRLYRGAQRDK